MATGSDRSDVSGSDRSIGVSALCSDRCCANAVVDWCHRIDRLG